MAGVRRYRDLIAWQLADEFKSHVFKLMKGSPAARSDLRFRSQLVEAASAVSKDIAEGFMRPSKPEFSRFLDYALGSLAEAEERVKDGVALEYFSSREVEDALSLAKRCTVATFRLKHSTRR